MAAKKYSGAPFGTQTSRFDVSGVHPQKKMPGTYTQAPYCKKTTSKENKLLGPGTYSIMKNDFSQKHIGPNWEKAFNSAKFNAIPHSEYRNTWEHKRELVKLMGPGKYEVKDFIQLDREKPASRIGHYDTTEGRFPRENKFRSRLPGPGTYGEGGVPSAAVEEKSRRAASEMGMLECRGREELTSRAEGSGLAPCRYSLPNSTDQLLVKRVSGRGPYDCFSGERYQTSRLLVERKHLGPGKYNFKPFTEDWNDKERSRQGRFSSLAQYPELPTERIFCSTLSQWPRDKDAPGPCDYKPVKNRPKSHSVPASNVAFKSSSRRFDKRALIYFSGNVNPVGTGQYDISRWHNHQHVHGSKHIFSSITPRLPSRADTPRRRLLSERLHPKRISSDRKLFVPRLVEAPG